MGFNFYKKTKKLKKAILKHHNACCHLKAKKVSVFKIGVFNLQQKIK